MTAQAKVPIRGPDDGFNGGDRHAFAQEMRVQRAIHQLNQTQVGDAVGVSYRTIGRWEHADKAEPPTRQQVRQLERLFNIENFEMLLMCGYAPNGTFMTANHDIIAVIGDIDDDEENELDITWNPGGVAA